LDSVNQVRLQIAQIGEEVLPEPANELSPQRGDHKRENTVSGIGQASAMFVRQGSLSQPLSESDLVRERVSNISAKPAARRFLDWQ